MDFMKGRSRAEFMPVTSDGDACFEDVLRYDLSAVVPQVACPHAVDNVFAVTDVEGTEIHQAVIGTCTNGRLEDLEAAAGIMKDKSVHPRTRTLVIPASSEEYLMALQK
jgi:homoaconitase/3-isopropylmalate dehydratase large subunit